ncbi:hypothetical protein DFH08DRAFT_1071469 [Mycena albidolilacea]|uniref:Uncharacterized protein n=1 Tax=Mycena albidolilacea TaxID=1033008 RepID=A0AAD7F781_9AGAR|nr:hypothetical protein DFH08DRAFT_1071469 [Mycena albidolilacea]
MSTMTMASAISYNILALLVLVLIPPLAYVARLALLLSAYLSLYAIPISAARCNAIYSSYGLVLLLAGALASFANIAFRSSSSRHDAGLLRARRCWRICMHGVI